MLYSCGCGYVTFESGNACRHRKKTACGQKMISELTEFIKDNEQIYNIKHLQNENTILTDKIKERENEIIKIKRDLERVTTLNSKLTKGVDNIPDEIEINSSTGLVYYIVDKDISSRAKIGRTKTTDVKKLKARYSTFSNPLILCFYSKDIKTDEKHLKDTMRTNGCMNEEIGKETIHHCDLTMKLFHEFCINRGV